MPLPSQNERRDHRLRTYGEAGDLAVVKVETITSRNGVRAQEFTLSKAAEAALQVDEL
jgi:hypothetical protein